MRRLLQLCLWPSEFERQAYTRANEPVGLSGMGDINDGTFGFGLVDWAVSGLTVEVVLAAWLSINESALADSEIGKVLSDSLSIWIPV